MHGSMPKVMCVISAIARKKCSLLQHLECMGEGDSNVATSFVLRASIVGGAAFSVRLSILNVHLLPVHDSAASR